MKEQSHKAEMATALRGDFARLRARGVATTLPTPPAAAVEATSAPAVEPGEPTRPTIARGFPAPGPVPAVAPAPGAAAPEIEVPHGAEPPADTVPAPAAEPRSATSWLDRLRGR